MEQTNVVPVVAKIRANGIFAYEFVNDVHAWITKKGVRIECDMKRLNAAVLKSGANLGVKQTVINAAAISDATEEQKEAAMRARISVLYSGAWDGKAPVVDGILLAALSRFYIAAKTPVPDEKIYAYLAKKSVAEQAALSVDPRFTKFVAEVKRDQTKGIDTKAMHAELDDLISVDPEAAKETTV